MSAEEAKPVEKIVSFEFSTPANQAIEFLENDSPMALKTVKDYFSLVIDRIKSFDILLDEEVTYDLVIKKAEEMISLRNEIIDVTVSIAEYQKDSQFYEELHSFFEKLLHFFSFRNEGEANTRIASDQYVLFGSELFIYTVAVLLRYRRFEQLNELTNQGYYIPRWRYNSPREFIPFCKFNQIPEALTDHYRRKNVSEESIKERFVKDRLYEEEFQYEDLAQADFFLHFISLLDIRINKERFSDIWHNQLRPSSYHFELFIRSESARFFEKFAKCLRSITKTELINFFKAFRENRIEGVSYYSGFDWERKIRLAKIATRA